ncbi:hypothetical protein V498_09040 [Pseudogymnoascus sp. VKM F-4517 (FW-2822)]|nr:hypothetical protein V498_09040 [Pseudogymnoascus sp. VKM F-4517 (FW-2822)]
MAWNSEFRQSNYSFINHAKNRERTDVGYQYLLKRARKGSKEWQLLQRAADGSYKWNDSQKQAYLNQERNFLRKLMVTLHVTGGQPAQGLEIGSIKEKDDEEDEGEFAEGDDEEELEQNTFRHIIVRQSGHGQRVAQAHYAVDGAFLHRLGLELITAYKQASLAWHELLGLTLEKGKHGRQASQQLTLAGIKRERRESRLEPKAVQQKALDRLQRIYGP